MVAGDRLDHTDVIQDGCGRPQGEGQDGPSQSN